ncbi:MAG TPA: secondary thiamine-phosphate synthase enzyme YjbQ [Brevefilum fermentans]|nr:secondary thiamine-phosphate synthase enzyme YjbQ [Brevefilum fermentans]MDI9566159.1 secondary thiamine-phosphate synthase enzyme YjbQ [Chloroflexota bacterium]HOM66668.1 secondary thiamine-phosphate synthase enzyme YjbQ [Brevefilum fermentans]
MTREINTNIQNWGVVEGMTYLFIPHTSASLVINESYDATARRDLEAYLDHIAPEGESWYVHTLKGRDDSPAHLRTMITATSLTIPVDAGRLSLGPWQGVYLAEHRRRAHRPEVLLRVLSVE